MVLWVGGMTQDAKRTIKMALSFWDEAFICVSVKFLWGFPHFVVRMMMIVIFNGYCDSVFIMLLHPIWRFVIFVVGFIS